MRRTIQCPQCGVVLNLPEDAEGKRLKCPKCANKFAANEADAKNSSAVRSHDASHDSVIGLNQSRIEKSLNPGRVEPAPTRAGPVSRATRLSRRRRGTCARPSTCR